MNSNTSILKKLVKTDLVSNFERAFGDATGLPVALISKDNWNLPLHGKRHENPFCALLAKRKACAGCLQTQNLLTSACTTPCMQTCPYKLIEAAVPVQVGKEVAGFLITGQVMKEKPTESQFDAICSKLPDTIDEKEAHDAYLASPVVSKRNFESSVQLLSIFAEHLTIKSNQLATQASDTEPLVITKARRYLAENAGEDITLEQTAKAAGASTFYLCKLFRRHMGMTFTEYLSRSRVECAKEKLLKANKRVSEVAFEAGFQSLTHFNRIFRKVVGTSPTEYRNKAVMAGV